MKLLDKQNQRLRELKAQGMDWLDEEAISLDEYLDVLDYLDQTREKLNKIYSQEQL